MKSKKLLFQNAEIATSTHVLKADLLVSGEKIFDIGKISPEPDMTVIDATGKYLLPGGVDVHTHLDLDVGIARASDDWYSGTVAAAFGGTTTIVDHMAFGPKGCHLRHQVGVYHELSKDAVIDYGFHGVVQHVDDEILHEMELLLREEGIASYKVYLTYDDMLHDDAILRVLQKARELGLVICAHCENDGTIKVMKHEFLEQGKKSTKYHPLSRPAACEAEAVWRMLMLAKSAKEANVYIVHLSTALGLEAIRTARLQGQKNIYAETCPHYLFLDDHLYDDPIEGLKYMMSPPLRKPSDQANLWGALQSGDIEVLGTDHCPFFFKDQKMMGKDDFTKTPNGVAGIETRMLLMLSHGFLKGRMSLPEIVRICSANPSKIFGLAPQKGDIQIGADADLILFDPLGSHVIRHSELHENVDYTPYEGIECEGKLVMTVSRGEIIVNDGKLLAERGRGNYLKRKAILVK